MKELLQIVLAEDNNGDVILIREALKEHKVQHELHVVKDGVEAARYIQQAGQSQDVPCPDILLLDLNLPKKSGHELLELIRAHPCCAKTPVIIVTSSDAERDRKLAAELGATRYFRKPSDIDEFMRLGAIVREVVEMIR